MILDQKMNRKILRVIPISVLQTVCIFLVFFFSGFVVQIEAQNQLAPVHFSVAGGFYSEALTLELTHPDPEVTIIYTLDGSEPELNHLQGIVYRHMDRYRSHQQQLLEKSYITHKYEQNDPIEIRDRSMDANYLSRMQTSFQESPEPYYFPIDPIFKGTVVRARAVKGETMTGPISTQTFFVTPDGRDRYSLPVISIAIQEDRFFDYESGIYVPGKKYDDANPDITRGDAVANHSQRGIEWERKASMEIFEPESVIADYQQEMGIRIHGGWSRVHPMKSLRLYARSDYGENRFRHQMFPDEPYTVFNRLILRNSGNDWPESMLRDPLMQRIVKHMNIDTQAYRPYILFLNGEYWGIHNMRERYDKHYLARKHGVDSDNIDLLTGFGWVKEGSNRHYVETLNYIRQNGLTAQDHYEYIQTRIDIENYIDYQIVHIFVANTDWPGNNIDFWRKATEQFEPVAPNMHDGRWRWLPFDLDLGFHLYEGCEPGNDVCTTPDHNTLAFASREDGPSWPNPPIATELFRAMLENEQFRVDFVNRYLDQLNTAFLPDRLVNEVREMAEYVEPEMNEHLDRWFSGRTWHHFNRWQYLINSRLIPFAEQRPDHARAHLKEFFDVKNEHKLTVDLSDHAGGYVQVNTVLIRSETPGVSTGPYPWSGTYFEGVPVVLVAHSFPGFRFSHWLGEGRRYHNPVIELNLTESESIKAVYYSDQDSDVIPKPHILREGSYQFDEWPASHLQAEYPDHMGFVYMDEDDPGLSADIAGFTTGIYNLDSRTRINGLDSDGFAFINTANENVGYPATRLGGAILGINTRRIRNIEVQWEGLTIRPNSRVYNLRLQYRIGDKGIFKDVLDEDGRPVEYNRNSEPGHRMQTGPIRLPTEAEDRAYVQLFWRYYHTGVQISEESGQRSKMAVSNISVEGLKIMDEELESLYPQDVAIFQNYPNPFNESTIVSFELPEDADIRLEIYDMLGRRVEIMVNEFRPAGGYHVRWDASGHASGIYMIRIETGKHVETRLMTLVK